MKRNARSTVLLSIFLLSCSLILYYCSKDDNPTSPNGNGNVAVQDTVRPIVFVHGRLGAADSWTPMIQYFRLNNFPRKYLHAMDLEQYYTGSFTAYDIPAMAGQVETFVNDVSARTGWARVDIIAHDIGVRAVQYYLTKKNGTDKIAHFVACGGMIDPVLTRAGSLTPPPVKYRTIRSDAASDGTMTTDSDGSMTGADNQQLGGLDHQRIITHENAFKLVYKFCTGTEPATVQFPLTSKNTLSGKVINFIDNTPVAGATVTLFNVNKVNGLHQLGGYNPVTTDAEGNWGPIEIDHNKMLDIHVSANGYHDTHNYRQEFRDSTFTERVRVFPKSGGSALLRSFVSAMIFSDQHAIVIMFSPNRTLYHDIPMTGKVDNTNVVTPLTTPLANNTFLVFCFDENGDRTTTTGPMASPLLHTYGISSYDLYMQAASAGQSILTQIMRTNPISVNTQNWKSSGTLNNTGISIVQYDNWN